LYNLNDIDDECDYCYDNRYDVTGRPLGKIKVMSIGDIVSKLLANPSTRQKLRYRHEREETPGVIEDFFDGQVYQQYKNDGKFDNPDDIAVALFTDGFVNEKRGNRLFTMVHLIILNYNPEVRYQDNHHYQLAILPGPKKPVSINSFLLPIVAELNYLSTYGMVVKNNGVEICRSKVHLVIASGDIPAVNDISKVAPHTSKFGCRICTTEGVHPDNHPYGMYFPNVAAPLRTLNEYKHGDPNRGIRELSLFSTLSTYTGSVFFGLDEMHMVGRGIGKLVYDMLTVDITKTKKFFYKYPNGDFEVDAYSFYVPKSILLQVGTAIEETREFIPLSFDGSFQDVIRKTRGTRAVDWLDFLLFIVPTLIVPNLSSRRAKQAMLRLCRGCCLALQWKFTADILQEIDACLRDFFEFCHQQISEHKLSVSVFKPVSHYLSHITYIIRNLGPLNVYSTRSQERAIGRYTELITAKVRTNVQASNLIEKMAIRSFMSHSIDVETTANILRPAPLSSSSYRDNDDDPSSDTQLWEPFLEIDFNAAPMEAFEGVEMNKIKKAMNSYYRRQFSDRGVSVQGFEVVVAGRAWVNSLVIGSQRYRNLKHEFRRANHYVMFSSTHMSRRNERRLCWFVGSVVFFFEHSFRGRKYFLAFINVMKEHKTADHDKSIPFVVKSIPVQRLNAEGSMTTVTDNKYAVVSVSDIDYQVGLIKSMDNDYSFQIVAPYHVFDSFIISTSAGDIRNL
jgi:hypothetical protein